MFSDATVHTCNVWKIRRCCEDVYLSEMGMNFVVAYEHFRIRVSQATASGGKNTHYTTKKNEKTNI